jgi:hypothetical protein
MFTVMRKMMELTLLAQLSLNSQSLRAILSQIIKLYLIQTYHLFNRIKFKILVRILFSKIIWDINQIIKVKIPIISIINKTSNLTNLSTSNLIILIKMVFNFKINFIKTSRCEVLIKIVADKMMKINFLMDHKINSRTRLINNKKGCSIRNNNLGR